MKAFVKYFVLGIHLLRWLTQAVGINHFQIQELNIVQCRLGYLSPALAILYKPDALPSAIAVELDASS